MGKEDFHARDVLLSEVSGNGTRADANRSPPAMSAGKGFCMRVKTLICTHMKLCLCAVAHKNGFSPESTAASAGYPKLSSDFCGGQGMQ